MKEKIFEAFKALGFELEEVEGFGYGFQYEGRNYLYMCSEDDDDFLNIVIPAVLDLEDENDICFYQLMDKINAARKYIKANRLGKSMWLSYERELFGDEDLKKVLTRMILHLDACLRFLQKAMKNSEKEED
jgi:hypothetical protein